jgi:hypothetical protein
MLARAAQSAGRAAGRLPGLRSVPLRRVILSAVLALSILGPHVGAAQERPADSKLWDSGAGKSYIIPAAEIAAFIAALNQFNRHLLRGNEYDTDGHSVWKNLRTAPDFDEDPFSVNQLGHPYQGSIYYGFARSAGLSYWESLGYTIGGSFLWETAGETTRPSINDHIASGIAGTFVGEAMFRMASLLLEGGGESPGVWRELGAAVLSPPTGFNRLVFGDRFREVFPSRNPEVFVRAGVGATVNTDVTNAGLPNNAKRQLGSADFSMIYGLPGKPGYRYTRPFDYFLFEFTGVPNADSAANAIENATIRGLLAGDKYEWGNDYRGLWGLFGGYDYLSPQIFRVSTTSLSLGSVGQWWLTRRLALQGTAIAGLGFGAAGTVADKAERDYHYGVVPQALLGLRLIFGERAMIDVSGRQFHVIGTGAGGGGGGANTTNKFGHEMINRGTVGLTVRVYGPHAFGFQYVVSSRDAAFAGRPDRHQSIEAATISYNFIGHTRFGAVEWRPEMTPR